MCDIKILDLPFYNLLFFSMPYVEGLRVLWELETLHLTSVNYRSVVTQKSLTNAASSTHAGPLWPYVGRCVRNQRMIEGLNRALPGFLPP